MDNNSRIGQHTAKDNTNALLRNFGMVQTDSNAIVGILWRRFSVFEWRHSAWRPRYASAVGVGPFEVCNTKKKYKPPPWLSIIPTFSYKFPFIISPVFTFSFFYIFDHILLYLYKRKLLHLNQLIIYIPYIHVR